MSEYELVAYVLGGIAAAAAWLYNIISRHYTHRLDTQKETIKELKKAQTEIEKQLNEFKTHVAGEYVKREEMRKHIESLEKKLDTIHTKIDSLLKCANGGNNA